MYTLTIVGLGPGDANFMTVAVDRQLSSAASIVLRTAKHPVADYLSEQGIAFDSCDDYYHRYDDFDAVYAAIVNDVIDKLDSQPVVYAVPGNPFLAEKTVGMLVAQLPSERVVIEHGSSFLDLLLTKLAHDPLEGLTTINALDLPRFDQYDGKVLVCMQCHSALVASELKIWLNQRLDDMHPIIIAQSIGIAAEEQLTELPLYQLDSYGHFDHHSSVVIIPHHHHLRHHLPALSAIMAELRAPGGCPWDREQDHASLRPYVLEEAYEVAEAISSGDLYALEDELGDLLLQVVFHAQIASENGDFNLYDVIEGISQKLIRRHPHVFAEVSVESSDDVRTNWEAIKRVEGDHQTTADVMKKYSQALPAAFRCQKVTDKAIKAGFTWQTHDQAITKLTEEIDELSTAIAEGDKGAIAEELGDCYFALGVVATRLGIQAELTAHQAIDKFIARFQHMEEHLADRRQKMTDLSLSELVSTWQRAKGAGSAK